MDFLCITCDTIFQLTASLVWISLLAVMVTCAKPRKAKRDKAKSVVEATTTGTPKEKSVVEGGAPPAPNPLLPPTSTKPAEPLKKKEKVKSPKNPKSKKSKSKEKSKDKSKDSAEKPKESHFKKFFKFGMKSEKSQKSKKKEGSDEDDGRTAQSFEDKESNENNNNDNNKVPLSSRKGRKKKLIGDGLQTAEEEAAGKTNDPVEDEPKIIDPVKVVQLGNIDVITQQEKSRRMREIDQMPSGNYCEEPTQLSKSIKKENLHVKIVEANCKLYETNAEPMTKSLRSSMRKRKKLRHQLRPRTRTSK